MNQLNDANSAITSASTSFSSFSSKSADSVNVIEDYDFSDGQSSSDGDHIETNKVTKIPEYCQVMRYTDEKGHVKEVLFPKNLDLERPKRARTNFTNKQLNELESAFSKNQYLIGKERKVLSKKLELSEAQIKVWYQNRRTKYKRELCKEKQRLEANAESIAANNIMQILQNNRPSVIPSPHHHHHVSPVTALNFCDNQYLYFNNFSNI